MLRFCPGHKPLVFGWAMGASALSSHATNNRWVQLGAAREWLVVEVTVKFSKEGAQDERRTKRASDVLHGPLLQVPHPHASRVVMRKPHRPGVAVIARSTSFYCSFD